MEPVMIREVEISLLQQLLFTGSKMIYFSQLFMWDVPLREDLIPSSDDFSQKNTRTCQKIFSSHTHGGRSAIDTSPLTTKRSPEEFINFNGIIMNAKQHAQWSEQIFNFLTIFVQKLRWVLGSEFFIRPRADPQSPRPHAVAKISYFLTSVRKEEEREISFQIRWLADPFGNGKGWVQGNWELTNAIITAS